MQSSTCFLQPAARALQEDGAAMMPWALRIAAAPGIALYMCIGCTASHRGVEGG